MRIAVDFDSTLIDEDEKGRPVPVAGAAEAMARLRAQGYEIVIHTCRTGIASKEGRLDAEIEWIHKVLEGNGIEFDAIYTGEKLVADAYIDDRAIAFSGDWKKTEEDALQYLEFVRKISERSTA